MSRRGKAALAGLALAFGAGSAAADDLAGTLVHAYQHSPTLDAARLDVIISAERAVQARANGRPTVTGTASLAAGVFDFEEGGFPTSLSLSVAQPLYTGGQVENSTLAAETRITAAEAAYIAQEQQVLLAAITAYMNLIRDRRFVSLSENNVRVLTEQLRAAQERFEVGEVTTTDVAQAEARLAAARSTLSAQIGALEVSKQNFLRTVGREPGNLEAAPPLPDLPPSRDEALAIAYRLEPNIAAARLEADAAGTDVRTAIGTLLPRLDLQADITREDILGIRGSRTSQATVGLAVTIPFYAGGGNYSRVREAQALVERRTVEINEQIRAAVEAVGTAWSNLEVARAAIRAGQVEVRAAELAFEGVSEEATLGSRTTLDVLDAEQELLTARANLVAARRDEQVAAYTLLAAMGLLTLDHLGLSVERDSGAGYYETVIDRDFGYDATDETVWTLPYRP